MSKCYFCKERTLRGKGVCGKHRETLVRNLHSKGKKRTASATIPLTSPFVVKGQREECVEAFYLTRKWKDGSVDIWKLIN